MLKNTLRRRLYVKKNTKVTICFILFSHQFSDRSYGSYVKFYDRSYGSYTIVEILIKLNSKFRTFDKIKFEIQNLILINLNSKFRTS